MLHGLFFEETVARLSPADLDSVGGHIMAQRVAMPREINQLVGSARIRISQMRALSVAFDGVDV